MAKDGFWDDADVAKKIMKERRELEQGLEMLEALTSTLDDAEVMLELAEEEQDKAAGKEAEEILERAEAGLTRLETTRLLGGPDDGRGAILAVNAGAGGTDAQDWAEMLLRQYTRYCERQGFELNILDMQDGDEAGIKGATIEIGGSYAYGLLKGESGIHRLVRISPFDASHRRHTAFASVLVTPQVDDDIEIDIKDADLRIDVFRASGAGGQHVNKTSSAVRMTHLPTGVVVQCQNEKSQHRNKDLAMKVLKARLYEMEIKKREEGKKGNARWAFRHRLGKPDPLIRAGALPFGQGPPHQHREWATWTRCWTAIWTSLCRPICTGAPLDSPGNQLSGFASRPYTALASSLAPRRSPSYASGDRSTPPCLWPAGCAGPERRNARRQGGYRRFEPPLANCCPKQQRSPRRVNLSRADALLAASAGGPSLARICQAVFCKPGTWRFRFAGAPALNATNAATCQPYKVFWRKGGRGGPAHRRSKGGSGCCHICATGRSSRCQALLRPAWPAPLLFTKGGSHPPPHFPKKNSATRLFSRVTGTGARALRKRRP